MLEYGPMIVLAVVAILVVIGLIRKARMMRCRGSGSSARRMAWTSARQRRQSLFEQPSSS
ncbi:hypothetical protein AJ88_19235 [Mesorhizobium amorphae CCBAU 01583]|nr:hypothetical protein AJ88_19235 [Mesorhizobium amorphae CCBAU 01583]